jgi:hypothetical protein
MVRTAGMLEQAQYRYPATSASAAPRRRYEIRNPLWVIVIGMAFLFAMMALIVALG